MMMTTTMMQWGLSRTGNKKPVHFKNFLHQLFQENVCIQDIPIKHQESRILVKRQDLAQPLNDGDDDDNDDKYFDDEDVEEEKGNDDRDDSLFVKDYNDDCYYHYTEKGVDHNSLRRLQFKVFAWDPVSESWKEV